MDQMEDIKLVFQKEMMDMQEIIIIEIRIEFHQWRLGTDGLLETQQVLTQMKVLHTDLMNKLGYNMAWVVIGLVCGGVFDCGLIGWR